MKIVYIAHPISGDVRENLEKIRLIVRQININFKEIVPFAPYWMDCHALDDSVKAERERGISNDITLIKRAVDEMWVFGDRISTGVAAEIELARSLDIPVIFNPTLCP